MINSILRLVLTTSTIALICAWTSAYAGPLRLDTSDPFISRLPKSRADFDRMFSMFVEVNSGAQNQLGPMTSWRVIDIDHDEAEEAVIFPDIGRHITFSGHGYSLTVRENGVVVESSINYADNMKLHTLRSGW